MFCFFRCTGVENYARICLDNNKKGRVVMSREQWFSVRQWFITVIFVGCMLYPSLTGIGDLSTLWIVAALLGAAFLSSVMSLIALADEGRKGRICGELCNNIMLAFAVAFVWEFLVQHNYMEMLRTWCVMFVVLLVRLGTTLYLEKHQNT